MTSALKLPDCISHQEGQLPNDVNVSKVLSSECYNVRVNADQY
jgi:hypothetical protein